MPVYTVHSPIAVDSIASAETGKFVFVRDGFHFWAFVGGVLWLIYHRLWWATLGYIVVLLVLEGGMSWLGSSAGVRFAVMALLALLMGLEAASLQRWTLSRRKWRQRDVVVADDVEAAERRFFKRWMVRDASSPETGPDWQPPSSMPSAPRLPSSAPAAIIGSFPEPGVSR